MTPMRATRQHGIALPVMLIILLVMLVGSIYLIKASNSTALTTSNLAYDSALSRAADLGLHTGFVWLSATAQANRAKLDKHDAANGYRATLLAGETPSTEGFWNDKKTIVDTAGNSVDYVVHRICKMELAYDDKDNSCMLTAPNTAQLGTATAPGASLSINAPAFAGTPQVHYVVTSRITGPRGGNVINQLVVLIGA
jgi:Tfp pilus assembly protein PilX